MKERRIECLWAGMTWFRHPRAPNGGPRVWTVLVRIGRKKRLPL